MRLGRVVGRRPPIGVVQRPVVSGLGPLPTIIFAMMVVRLIVLRLGGVVVTIFVATILDGTWVVQPRVLVGLPHDWPAGPGDERERGARESGRRM